MPPFPITIDTSVGASFVVGNTGGGAMASATHALCSISTATAGALTDTPYIVRRYSFSHEPMPPDTVYMTPWSDLGYQFQKVARNVLLDIDTAGVAATVLLQADGSTQQTFSVTTTSHDRDRVLSCDADLEGKFWRLTLTPGASAKTQLFKAGLDYVPDTNIVTYLDTYEQDFGYVSWKYIKRGWVEYKGGPITLEFFVDGYTSFYSVTLPLHTVRDMTAFYLPAAYGGVLNKSKIYRIQITGEDGFRLYADSELEWYAFGSDQLGSFSMAQFSPEMKLPIAQAAVGMWGV